MTAAVVIVAVLVFAAGVVIGAVAAL